MNHSNNCNLGPSRTVTVTSAIAEVTGGTPNILRYSRGTRFMNFSSFCTWTVSGLTKLPSGTTSVESAPFTHQNTSEWCLVLTNQSDGFYLSFLLKKCGAEEQLKANLKADEILPTGKKRAVFPWRYCAVKQGGKSEAQLVKGTGVPQNKDQITLQCEVCIQCIIQDKLPVAEAAELHVGVMKGLYEMFENEVLTDFELHAGGTVFKVHRAFLSVRSCYFAAMLQPHTKEAKEGRVDVTDMKPEVLKQVLLYLYTGEAPALKDMPWDLAIAADMYQLDHLKRQCETHIGSCLNVENAAKTIANAKDFSCDILRDCAVTYIKQNFCKVVSTPGWIGIIDTHPEIVKNISSQVE